jgi:hypothetical protein
MIDSSLTRGSERTRSRSETVTTTAPGFQATGEAAGVAGGIDRERDALGVAGPLEGEAGVELQPASTTTTRRTRPRRWFTVRIRVASLADR